MKLNKKSLGYGDYEYCGRKSNFLFNIQEYSKGFYVCCEHKKLDIRFNSLWEHIVFITLEDAKLFCEGFNYKKHNCLGKDLKIVKV